MQPIQQQEAAPLDKVDMLVNPEAMQNNMNGVMYVRALMAIISGIVAGILGLTSLNGFLFYLVSHLLCSFFLLVKMNFEVKKYWGSQATLHGFAFDGLSGQAMSFILWWTLSYAMVFLY